jgi:hypothetical protein
MRQIVGLGNQPVGEHSVAADCYSKPALLDKVVTDPLKYGKLLWLLLTDLL